MDRPRLKRRSHNIKENWNVLNRTKNPRSLAGKAPIFSHFLHLASSLNYFCLESKFRKEKVFFWMRTLLFCSLINPGSEQKITALNLFCLQKQWHKSYLPLKKFLETQFHFMLKFNLLCSMKSLDLWVCKKKLRNWCLHFLALEKRKSKGIRR